MIVALLLLSSFEPRFSKCPETFVAEFHTVVDVSSARPGWRGASIDCEARAIVLGSRYDVMQRAWTKLPSCAEPGCIEEARVAALLVTEMLKTEPENRAPPPQQAQAPMQMQPPFTTPYQQMPFALQQVPRWVRPVRGAGIGLTVLGGASLVVGVMLTVMGIPPRSYYITDYRSYQNDTALMLAGLSLIGSGVGLTSGGITMIVVAQRAKMRAILAPAIVPGGGALNLSGTF